ncbi:MAG: MerR family transcriptional regulator [Clostridiales bacterium]|nr:MerR family transcriptional regulator [Clostridiales bacterium]
MYKIGEISSITGVKAGTVRFYEKCGFLEEIQRLPNGYRIYNDHHVFQIRVCDIVFDSFVNSRLRKLSMKLIRAAQAWDEVSFGCALKEYRDAVITEINRTKRAIELALEWNFDDADDGTVYTKKQAADLVGTTPEAIRNWERNGLIPKQEAYRKRYYTQSIIERMYVIRLLLDTGYSIMAILKFLNKMDGGKKAEAKKELTDPESGDLQSRADFYLKALGKIRDDTGKIENLASAHHLLI